jgi:hypothetical protein
MQPLQLSVGGQGGPSKGDYFWFGSVFFKKLTKPKPVQTD